MFDWDVWKPRWQWLISSLCFLGIPFLLFSWGFGTIWYQKEKNAIDVRFEELDQVLFSIRRIENTANYLQRLFRKMIRKAEAGDRRTFSSRCGSLKEQKDELQRRFPGMLTFVVADGDGKIVSELSDVQPPADFLKNLFFATRPNAVKEDFSGVLAYKDLVKTYVGEQISLSELNSSRAEVIEVATGLKNHWFFFGGGPYFRVLINIHDHPDWTILSMRDACRTLEKTRHGRFVKAGVFKTTQSGAESPDVLKALGLFQVTGNPHIRFGGSFYSFQDVSAVERLWVHASDEKIPSFAGSRLLLVGGGTIFFAIDSLFLYSLIVKGNPLRLSIRWQISLLYLYAGGLPVILLMMSGIDYLDQTLKMRIFESNDRLEQTLKAFDKGFPQRLGQWQSAIMKRVKPLRFQSPADMEHTYRTFRECHKTFHTHRITIYDPPGNAIWESDIQSWEKPGPTNKLFKSFYRKVLQNLNQTPEEVSFDAATAVMESIGGIANPLLLFTKSVGQIVSFGFGGKQRTSMMICPLRDAQGKATHLVRFFWGKLYLENCYVADRLPKLERLFPKTRMVFYNPVREIYVGNEGRVSPAIRRFFTNLSLKQTTVNGRIRINRQNYFATGIKLTDLKNGYLMAYRPERMFLEDIKMLRTRMALLYALIIGVCLFVGMQISAKFLFPISRLSDGVNAIARRNFRYRLELENSDELGALARTFNRVMDGMADLDVGRIVQTSLFPSDELVIGEYHLYGVSRAMNQVGGDYLDYQSLSDGRILLVIGDVAGHGLPAALVMAMARATIERETEHPTTPEPILQRLHRTIAKTMKRRKMMTCFIILIDPATHQCRLANGGHNYPYLLRKGAAPKAMELKSMPLGVSTKAKLGMREFCFEPGDTLFLYTDGLVEAQTESGAVGYDRVVETVAGLVGSDPKSSCHKILAWQKSIAPGTEQSDDITVALIQRFPVGA